MTDSEKLTLHGQIESGEVDIKDITYNQLKSLEANFGYSYNPDHEFWVKIFREERRREQEADKVNYNYY